MVIDDEITEYDLNAYDAYLRDSVFPGKNPDEITELSGDGIEKILMKVGKRMHQKTVLVDHKIKTKLSLTIMVGL